MLICGALPPEEMPRLAQAKDLSAAEQRQLISWQDPPAWSAAASNDAPPGRGNFMIKIGGRPGIPFHVTLTAAEERLHDTNKLWHEHSRRGELITAGHALEQRQGGLNGGAAGRQARHRPLGALAAAAGTLGLLALAGVAVEAAAQAGAAIDHWRHRPPHRPARAGARARRRPHPLAAGRDADPDRSRRGLRAGRERASRCCAPGGRPPARIARRGCWAPAAAAPGVARRTPERPPSGSASSSPGCRSPARSPADSACTPPGRTCRSTSGARATASQLSRAIPTLLAAPGAVFATSNKPDLYAATRLVREQPRAGVEVRPRAARRRRARLVVEPAHLRHLRPPRARAHRRVRRRLPRPGRAPRPVLRPRRPRTRRAPAARRRARRAAAHAGVPVVDAPERRRARADPRGPRPRARRGVGARSRARAVRAARRRVRHRPADPLVPARPRHRPLGHPHRPADRRPQLDLAAFVRASDTLYLLCKEGQGARARGW